jgi:hypothetical protein
MQTIPLTTETTISGTTKKRFPKPKKNGLRTSLITMNKQKHFAAYVAKCFLLQRKARKR